MGKEQAIIVDLEGTLSDHSDRLHHLENKDYDKYNAEFQDDPINKKMVEIIHSYEADIKIIMVTAKSEVYRQNVDGWLAFNGIDDVIDIIYYRDILDSRPSMVVKQDILKQILEKFDIIAAYDDRPDICAMYENYDIPTHLVEIKISPANILKNAAKTFEDKNKEYGNGYKEFGNIMQELFPNGLYLKSRNDFSRFAIFNIMLAKIDRYAKNFQTGHGDSLHDISIYAAMLQGIDNDIF